MTTPIAGYELTDSCADYELRDDGPPAADPAPKRPRAAERQLQLRTTPPYRCPPSVTQELPFTVKIVQSRADLERLCEHRASAYSRHQPDLVKKLRLNLPEPDDARPDVVILVAENKSSGQVVGSMRLRTNLHTPLKFEEELTLPAYMQGRILMEAGRLTASRGTEGHMVVPAMVKVSYEIAHQTGVDYSMLIGRPPIDKMYRAMQFSDVFDGELVVTSAQPGVPVHLFCMPMEEAEQRWLDAQCPLYDFMATTRHPDLVVDPMVAFQQFQRWG